MEREAIDALLLTDDRNISYFTGAGLALPREDRARPSFVVIPRSGEVGALISHSRCVLFRESSWVKCVRTYDGLGSEVIHFALVSLIREFAPVARTIGMELGYEHRLGMTIRDYEALKAHFSNVEFGDAAQLLWKLRMVKSEAEIARVERAVKITDSAYSSVFPTLRAGMTEREIANRLHAEMSRLGASATWVWLLSGDYDRGGLLIRERAVEAGEMVWVDMGANFLAYYSDFSRAAVLGMASAHQRDMQEKIREVTAIGVEAIKPGRTMAEVASACDRAMEERGLTFALGARYGHGMGLQVTEPPHVARYDETVIVPGMVLTMEPGTWSKEGRFHIEENVVVTDTGVRWLSQAPRELYEVNGER